MASEQVRRSVRRKVGRVLAWVVGLGLLVVGVAGAYDRYASAQVLAAYPAPGEFVSINGSQMHVLCQGTGEPTLVLQAGFGGGALDWSPIMPLLADQRRVCAFDRLGQDYSDPAPTPRQFGSAADDLHIALGQLGIEEPVVVGHSLGGAVVQIYAARYAVSGVILVEGLTTEDVDSVVRRIGSYQSLNALGRIGLLRPIGSTLVNPSYPEEAREQMKALRSGSTALLSLTAEGASAAATAGAELAEAEPKIVAPMLLIGAEQSDVPDLPPGKFSSSLRALAARKPNSTFVEVADARHYVQAEQPEQVAAIIKGWLAQR